MLSDSVGPNNVSGAWSRRLERRMDGNRTHGERGDVSNDGGRHSGSTTPDWITEEKPSSDSQ